MTSGKIVSEDDDTEVEAFVIRRNFEGILRSLFFFMCSVFIMKRLLTFRFCFFCRSVAGQNFEGNK